MSDVSSLRKRSLFVSIDTLTDGSELTGDGTLFLSFWKSSSHPNFDSSDAIEHFANGQPVARYAITGLGDATSRLAADQRFKLHTVRAVFCTSKPGIWGLPGLQIALHQSGSAELTIVSSVSEQVERITALLEARRRHPIVRLCNVPEGEANVHWYLVYRDEYLVVHASRLPSSFHVVYLYTIIHLEFEPGYSLIVTPATEDLDCSPLLRYAPVIDGKTVKVSVGISLKQQIINPGMEFPWYYTSPDNQNVDPFLHVRAQNQSRMWHRTDPVHFPWRGQRVSTENNGERRLRSGSSLILSCDNVAPFLVNRVSDLSDQNANVRNEIPDTLQYFLKGQVIDENEIDLDEVDEKRSAFLNFPYLMVLGTGCATPSPYRGSSAYGLVLSDNATVAIEAGEGFASQWLRYASGRSLATIGLIFVSHAHWDHFGGLINLLVSIYDANSNFSTIQSRLSNKKRRVDNERPPLVLATRKVLTYLEVYFENETHFYYRPQPIEESNDPNIVHDNLGEMYKGLIGHWTNVRVDHSCWNAYGFIARLLNTNRTFAFSGDTLPSRNFIMTCKTFVGLKNVVDFLLHEATFEDNEERMAIKKKHSTVKQALQVAQDLGCDRVLLTHFSQRYDNPITMPHLKESKVACALDGISAPI